MGEIYDAGHAVIEPIAFKPPGDLRHRLKGLDRGRGRDAGCAGKGERLQRVHNVIASKGWQLYAFITGQARSFHLYCEPLFGDAQHSGEKIGLFHPHTVRDGPFAQLTPEPHSILVIDIYRGDAVVFHIFTE